MALAKKVTVGDYWARARRRRPAKGPHDGRLYWVIESRVNSKLVHHRSEWATRTEIKNHLIGLVAANAVEVTPVIDEIKVVTLLDLSEYWLGFQMSRDESEATNSWKKNCRNSAKRLISVIGNIPVMQLTDAHLLQYRTKRLKESSSRTVHQDVKMLRSMWQWGQLNGLCPERRAPTVKIKIEDVREKPIPAVEDVHQILDVLVNKGVAWPFLCTLIALHTGARTGEIANLRWSDIDVDRCRIRFRTRKNKTDQVRYRIVEGYVMELIEAYGTPGKAADGIFGVTTKMVHSPLGSEVPQARL